MALTPATGAGRPEAGGVDEPPPPDPLIVTSEVASLDLFPAPSTASAVTVKTPGPPNAWVTGAPLPVAASGAVPSPKVQLMPTGPQSSLAVALKPSTSPTLPDDGPLMEGVDGGTASKTRR